MHTPAAINGTMRTMFNFTAAILFSFSSVLAQEQPDTTTHRTQFVTVAPDVKLEVVDWGGKGRSLIFLAGLDDTAHEFDGFAPALTANYHVYGVTRRGFGLSSKPEPDGSNYSADRLGDDVIKVIEVLKLDRPVLIGHSIAGEELSSVGSRRPDLVSGLVYLDAAYAYAFYDRQAGDMHLDALDLKVRIEKLINGAAQTRQYNEDLLSSASQLEKDLRQFIRLRADLPVSSIPPPIDRAVLWGERKYTSVLVPTLVFFVCPHDIGDAFRDDEKERAALLKSDEDSCSTQLAGFKRDMPAAQLIVLPHANHNVFLSNRAQVLEAIERFMARTAP